MSWSRVLLGIDLWFLCSLVQVLVICFVLCTCMYGGIAIMGYTMFGDEIQSQITLNLPRELPASNFAIWITLISPFAKYALTLMPLAVALEEFLPHSMTNSRKGAILGGTILRTLLVMSTVVVALAIPFFGLLMAFIGSFLSVAVSIHIPCVCYLRIYRRRLPRREMYFILLIISLGLFVGVVGTCYSVKRILEENSWSFEHLYFAPVEQERQFPRHFGLLLVSVPLSGGNTPFS